MFVFVVIGAAAGAAAAFFSDMPGRLQPSEYSMAEPSFGRLAERFFVYLWPGAAIWFSGFVKAGAAAIPFILALKGAGLAFTSVLIGAGLGWTGVFKAITALFLQNFMLFFVYLYLAEVGFRHIRDNSPCLREYILCFALAGAATALAVGAEALGL